MRKLIYHCAITVDGFVAGEGGSIDFFEMQGPHVDDFIAGFSGFDDAIMGRKTYEVGLRMGVEDPYPFLKTHVASRTMKESTNPKVKIVSENVAQYVHELKQQEGKDIWLVGAGELAAALFAENLIDEITLKINPVAIGTGIPMIAFLKHPTQLKLLNSKVYENGVVLLSYQVKHG
jgi:dihydrofolate reductase